MEEELYEWHNKNLLYIKERKESVKRAMKDTWKENKIETVRWRDYKLHNKVLKSLRKNKPQIINLIENKNK